jgi:signal transduction histidine kinase
MRLRTRVLLLALAGALVSLFAGVAQPLPLFYDNPNLAIVLVTGEAAVGLLAAFLVVGRVQRSRRLDDLLLCCGLATFGAANLLFGALPAVFSEPTLEATTWAALAARMIGVGLIVGAALVPDRRLRLRQGWSTRLVIRLAWTLLASILLGHVLAAALPAPGLDAGEPLIAPIHLVAAVLLAIAAAGFTRRAEREPDPLREGMALACVLAVIARVDYAVFATDVPDALSIGDAFRLLFYVTVAAAVASEIREHWAASAEASPLRERRRVARELHDGLTQELASIRRDLAWLDADDELVRRAVASCDRALTSARGAIATLRDRPLDQPFADALAEAATQVALRERTSVRLEVEPGVNLTPLQCEAVIAITAEAITNAARHGGADVVQVALDTARLEISDAGRGFDPAEAEVGSRHYGIRGMHEQAAELGGIVEILSLPGRGTRVVVPR